jgi:hypothetical protein
MIQDGEITNIEDGLELKSDRISMPASFFSVFGRDPADSAHFETKCILWQKKSAMEVRR